MQNTPAIGEEHDVLIEDVAFGGDGVGRIDGMTVFVPFTLTGERVRIAVTHVQKRYLRGRLLEVQDASASRTTPRCPWHGVCAGCQYQHIDYPEQLRLKEAQVRTLFERIGGIPAPPIASMVASPQPYGYRSTITLHGPGRPAYVGIDKRRRVEVDHCPIAQESINAKLIEWVRRHPDGLREHRDLGFRTDADGRVWVHDGKDHTLITQSIGGHTFRVPLSSFFQVNRQVTEAIITYLRGVLADSGCRTLIDAYGGVGVFGILCADLVEKIWVIESDARAIRAGKQNAARAGAAHMHFVPERVEHGLSTCLRRSPPLETACLLDPPRRGCATNVLQTLLRHKVRRVLYLSCAPDCMARDVKQLVAGGYRLVRVTPFDMFPQTAHIEALAELESAPDGDAV